MDTDVESCLKDWNDLQNEYKELEVSFLRQLSVNFSEFRKGILKGFGRGYVENLFLLRNYADHRLYSVVGRNSWYEGREAADNSGYRRISSAHLATICGLSSRNILICLLTVADAAPNLTVKSKIMRSPRDTYSEITLRNLK